MTAFKDRKTGKIFDNILDAYYWYKCPGPCTDCGLSRGSMCTVGWVEDHPLEAAKIMGFEVLEGEKMRTESNIAKLLGVETGQNFRFGSYITEWHIESAERVVDKNGELINSTALLLEMINHPERIKISMSWDSEDIEDANAVRRLFPMAETITKCVNGDIELTFSDATSFKFYWHGRFPSAKPGVTYPIKEITW